jgi:predicted acylesterase/phospholipase RssA
MSATIPDASPKPDLLSCANAEKKECIFKQVLETESSEVRKRREVWGVPDTLRPDRSKDSELPDYAPEPPPSNLVGLALSGGGIRSATFALGLLQELSRLKLLNMFDYLSTVSGGGYVAGWWSAWLSRSERKRELHKKIFPPPEQGEPHRWRAYIASDVSGDVTTPSTTCGYSPTI